MAAGGSTTFTVQFAPDGGGHPTATVSFSENDTTTTSPFTFAIGGTASVASASLSGTAYDDITKNGVLSSSDPVLSGVTIALTGTDASGNTVNLTTTTASDGTYSFGSLAAGTSYTLTATLPSYLAAGTATAGSITPASSSNGTAAGEVISGINLAAGAVGTGYNFGAYGVASQVFSGSSSSSTGGNDATIESIMLFSASGPSVSQVLNPLTITGLSNQTVAPGTATSAIPFTVSDVLDPTAKLTVTGTSSNTTVVPTANVVYGGSGADRTITVTPAASRDRHDHDHHHRFRFRRQPDRRQLYAERRGSPGGDPVGHDQHVHDRRHGCRGRLEREGQFQRHRSDRRHGNDLVGHLAVGRPAHLQQSERHHRQLFRWRFDLERQRDGRQLSGGLGVGHVLHHQHQHHGSRHFDRRPRQLAGQHRGSRERRCRRRLHQLAEHRDERARQAAVDQALSSEDDWTT